MESSLELSIVMNLHYELEELLMTVGVKGDNSKFTEIELSIPRC
jgi:hypothetical protein